MKRSILIFLFVLQLTTMEKTYATSGLSDFLAKILNQINPSNTQTANLDSTSTTIPNTNEDKVKNTQTTESYGTGEEIQLPSKQIIPKEYSNITPEEIVKIDQKPSQVLEELESNKQSQSNFEGTQTGQAIGKLEGTTFCTERDGSLEKEGFTSCAGRKPYIGSCKNNSKCAGSCKNNPDCNYVKGSCQTPNYYFKGNNRKNAVIDANKQICEVALSRANLRKLYGKGKAYCNKKIVICNGSNCQIFPITSTGLSSSKRIDLTGCVTEKLKMSGRSQVGLDVFKL